MISHLFTNYRSCSFVYAPSVAKSAVWAVRSILAPTHPLLRLLRGKTISGELILPSLPSTFALVCNDHGDCRVYRAVMNRDTKKQSVASSQRHFCTTCSTMLWLYDEHWYVWYWLLCSAGGDLYPGQTFYIPSHL